METQKTCEQKCNCFSDGCQREPYTQLQPISASHTLCWILSAGHEVNDFVLCQIRFIIGAWINLSVLCGPLRHHQAKP